MMKIFGMFLLIFLCLSKTTTTVEFDTIPTDAIIVESNIITSIVFSLLSSVTVVKLVGSIAKIIVLSMFQVLT